MKGRRHNILRQEWLGPWELTMGVGPTGRFIIHLRHLREESWSSTKFFSSSAQADHEFYEWRDKLLVQLAIKALGVE